MHDDPPGERTPAESEHERESRRIRETTPRGPRVPQSPTASGEGESGTGDYGVELGAGGHRGFGPDDDAATAPGDATLRDEIRELLEAAGVTSSDVDVVVADGAATLAGTVEDPQAKQRVEDIVRGARGVNDVDNKLRVRGTLP